MLAQAPAFVLASMLASPLVYTLASVPELAAVLGAEDGRGATLALMSGVFM